MKNNFKSKTKVKSKLKGYNGFPEPKEVKCFKCSKSFLVKFVISCQAYSQKNNWSYWTGETKEQKICNPCLRELYYNKLTYWKTVKDSKKRALFRVYLSSGKI